MTQQSSCSNTKLDKTINPEQFNQLIEAIIAGKYSWACVLLLRFAGYNPLHYIPYRTYNRLLKENCQFGSRVRHQNDIVSTDNKRSETTADGICPQKCLGKISELGYLEVVGEQQAQLSGGTLEQWLSEKIIEYSSLKVEVLSHKNQRDSLSI